MRASFPRQHHALYQGALASRRPGRDASRPGTPGIRVAYLANLMHNLSQRQGPCPDSDQIGRTHGCPGGGGGRQRLRGRGTAAHHRRAPGSGTRAARRRDERGNTGHRQPPAPGAVRGPCLRAPRPGPAVLGGPGVPRAPARGVGCGQRRHARRRPRGGPQRQLPPRRPAGVVGVLPDPARRPVVLRTARTARGAGADRRRAAGGLARLLRDGGHPGPRAAARRGPGRSGRHRDRGRLRHLRGRPLPVGGAAGHRGHRRDGGLPGRRHAPAHAGDRAGAARGAGQGGRPPWNPPGRRWRLAGKPAGPIARAGLGARPRTPRPGTSRWRRAGRVVHPDAGPDAPGHPRDLHRAAGRPGHGHRGAAGGAGGRLRRRTVRPAAPRGPLAGHRGDERFQHGAPAGRRRPARRAGGGRRRPRQPRQGRGRPGGPSGQPHARPARDRGPVLPGSCPVSVTAPLGFRAAGVAAGLKASGARDVAVVINDGPSRAAAAVFTANRVKAAPVLWTQQVVKGGRVRAVLLNSGGANACTGPLGFADTHLSAERLAVGLSDSAGEIRTTDTVAKIAFHRSGGYTIGGMAKGAGMLAPALATMLCVLATDADLDPGDLDAALRAATRVTFDRLDTDGCMSTNDTVLLLASGASGERPEMAGFTRALTGVCADLARQLQADAEGAGKLIAIEVVGAAGEDDAVTAGRAVARSALLKCAIAGADPNWGRVLSAVGTTDAVFDPDRINVAINGVWVCRNGCAADDRSKVDLGPRDVTITVDLSAGPAAATIRTTDLTTEYVHENSAYST